METISPRSTPITPTTPLQQPMVLIPAAPPGLMRLEIGEKLEAFVLQGMTKGLAEIDTPFGKLQLTTNFPLHTQTKLQLQVIGKFPFMQLLITSIQGLPSQLALRNLTTSNAVNISGSAQVNTHSISSNTAQSKSSEPITLTLGANVIATKPNNTLIATSPPKLDMIPSPSGPKNQTAAGTNTPPLEQGTSENYSTNNTIKHSINQYSVRITKIVPSSQLSSGGGLPATENKSLAVGESVTGVVTMTNRQGHAVVQTHTGPMILAIPNSLPPGTTISFSIITTLDPLLIGLLGGTADSNSEVIMKSHQWPELNDAVKILNEEHPTLGQQVMNSIIPKAGTALAANIIFLVSAIRSGDIKNWFGDAPVRALQRMKPELMSRIRDDFSQISRLSDDNTSSVWRSYPLPFLNGQEIEQIRLYIKRKSESDDEDTEPPDQGTRFILDLDLAHIGKLQLDGLVRSSQKKFDLILRTNNPLQPMLQNGIRDIFQKSTEQTGHIGGLSFQATPAVFINITPNRTHSPNVGFIV